MAFTAPFLLDLAPAIRLPAVLLEIEAGIVLGPSVLGVVEVDESVEVTLRPPPAPSPTSSTGASPRQDEAGRERASHLDLVPADRDVLEARRNLAVLDPVDRQLDLALVER